MAMAMAMAMEMEMEMEMEKKNNIKLISTVCPIDACMVVAEFTKSRVYANAYHIATLVLGNAN